MVVLGDLCCDSLVGFIGSKLSLQSHKIPKTKGLSLEYRGLKLYQCMCRVCVFGCACAMSCDSVCMWHASGV